MKLADELSRAVTGAICRSTAIHAPRNPRRGERHPKARLSDEQVRNLRERYLARNKGYSWLAKELGLSLWTVRDIVTYRTRVDA